jgi:hypothetical protein
MNGNLIHELYRMCLSNRESMFHTLQKEISILNSNNQPLTLLIFLRFLDEIQKHIPVSDTDHFFRDPIHSELSRLSPYPTRFKGEIFLTRLGPTRARLYPTRGRHHQTHTYTHPPTPTHSR